MRRFPPGVACAALLALATIAPAQSGTLDQVSPYQSTAYTCTSGQGAWFNGGASSLTWQCQVKAGLSGQLEGFELELVGVTTGSHIDAKLRLGPGWNTSSVVWSGSHDTNNTAWHTVYFDVTSANINLNAGDVFVIELHGNDTGMGISGTYVPPSTGSPPCYPEYLYLNGPGCFADCGWRIGFKTWMLTGPPPFTLAKSGSCPGSMTFTTTNGTPSGTVAFVWGTAGSFTIPAGKPCAGTVLDLSPLFTPPPGYMLATANGSGSATLGPVSVPAAGCGLLVQALDVATCTKSNTVTL